MIYIFFCEKPVFKRKITFGFHRADSKYPFGYAQDKLSNLNRYGMKKRRFKEVLRSVLYYAFGKMIHEDK